MHTNVNDLIYQQLRKKARIAAQALQEEKITIHTAITEQPFGGQARDCGVINSVPTEEAREMDGARQALDPMAIQETSWNATNIYRAYTTTDKSLNSQDRSSETEIRS